MINEILKRQIESGNIFHSYIFEGNLEETENQWKYFAKKLLDTDIDIENLVEIIEPENNNIKINQIREFNKYIYEKPSNFKYRIFIIKNAHFMRIESQNALLKTLEDMPSYAILIMTTDNKFKLLDTIISRSQSINLKSDKNIVDFNSEITKNVINLVEKVLDGNYYIISKEKNLFKELSEFKHESLYILTKIFSGIYYEDLENTKYNNLLRKLLILNIKSREKILLKIESIKNYLKVNINFQIAMEDLIFTIIYEINKSREDYENKEKLY